MNARELVSRCLGGAPFGAAGDGIAIIDGEVRLSHRELTARVRAGAAALSEQGVRPGWFLGVPAIRSVDTVVAILACWAAGAAYCPIDPAKEPPEHIAAVLDAFAVPNGAPMPRHPVIPAVNLPLETVVGTTRGAPSRHPVLDTGPAYLMTTSGSSGAPKATVVTRGGLRAVFGSLYTALAGQLPAGARWTQLHPLTFGYSVCELLGSLVFGGQLVLVPREEPLTLRHLSAEIGGSGAHVVCLTPSELAVLVDRARSGAGRLPSHILLSGEAAHKAPLAELFALGGNEPPVLINTYAATETSGQITAHLVTPVTLGAVADGYVGAPLPGVDVMLRRPDGHPIPQSDTKTIGQIHVGGPTLAAGYLDPIQTQQRFVIPAETSEINYATGDLGQWSDLGGLRVVGRADRMVKLGGQWVGMEQIERLVAESDLVAEVAAYPGRLGSAGPDCLYLTVVPHRRERHYATRLRDDVLRRLPLRTTVRLTTTDQIPRLPNGKVDMAGLAKNAVTPHMSERLTRNVSRTVRIEWNALLGAGVATDKNLFEMGVDSLGIVAAATRLSKALDFPVTPEFLLNNPRIDFQIACLTTLIEHRSPKSMVWEEHNLSQANLAVTTPKGI